MSPRCNGKGGRARTQTHLWCRTCLSHRALSASSHSRCARRCGGSSPGTNVMPDAGAASLGCACQGGGREL
eukprot:674664-Pyramimonas_sp.AAC.2